MDARRVSRRGQGTKDFPTLRAFAAAEPLLLDRAARRGSPSCRSNICAANRPRARTRCRSSTRGPGSSSARAGEADPAALDGAARGRRPLGDPADPVRPERAASRRRVRELARGGARVDWRVDLKDLQARYPDRSVQGNLEPAILIAGRRRDARRRARVARRDCAARPHRELGAWHLAADADRERRRVVEVGALGGSLDERSNKPASAPQAAPRNTRRSISRRRAGAPAKRSRSTAGCS